MINTLYSVASMIAILHPVKILFEHTIESLIVALHLI